MRMLQALQSLIFTKDDFFSYNLYWFRRARLRPGFFMFLDDGVLVDIFAKV